MQTNLAFPAYRVSYARTASWRMRGCYTRRIIYLTGCGRWVSDWLLDGKGGGGAMCCSLDLLLEQTRDGSGVCLLRC